MASTPSSARHLECFVTFCIPKLQGKIHLLVREGVIHDLVRLSLEEVFVIFEDDFGVVRSKQLSRDRAVRMERLR